MDNKFEALSKDIHQAERDKLQTVFPECFVEGKLDIDKLLNLCGEYIDESFEKYRFEWKGKADCFRVMGRRSTGTLRPAPDESVNFDTTKNLYIEGDNLEVLKLLQTSYYRKVKMIYIDPPYNTGNDFVYNDDFKDPIAHYKEVTSQATKSNPETMGRFHTAWLNMMYPRLRLAANLLRDDGVIFISIDDNEVTNLRKLCDEVFGEENFVGKFVWQSKKGGGSDNNAVVSDQEYVLCYAKSLALGNSLRKIVVDAEPLDKEDGHGKYRVGRELNKWGSNSRREDRPTMFFPIPGPNGEEVYPIRNDGSEGCWRWGKENMLEAVRQGNVEYAKRDDGTFIVYEKIRTEEPRQIPYRTLIEEVGTTADGSKLIKALFDDIKIFDYAKPIDLIKKFIEMGAGESDIILDFFSGSATTAHAVMQLNAEDGGNRRFIMVQLPEATDEKSEACKAGYKNICEIGKERIRRAGAKIFEQGVEKWSMQKISEEELPETVDSDGVIERSSSVTYQMNLSVCGKESPDLDTGFRVLKLDTSNLLAWDASPIPDHDLDVLWQRFDARDKTLKPDRSDMDIVFEVMLKMGLPLDCVVSEITVGSKKCYSIGEKVLVCLEFGITPEDIVTFCDFEPAKIICAEEAFADSNVMSNAHYILRDRGIEMKLL